MMWNSFDRRYVGRAEQLAEVPVRRGSRRRSPPARTRACPSGKWPQKMIEKAHRLRIRLAVALAASVDGNERPGEQRQEHVVLAVGPGRLLSSVTQHARFSAQRLLAARDPLGLEVVEHHPVWKGDQQRWRRAGCRGSRGARAGPRSCAGCRSRCRGPCPHVGVGVVDVVVGVVPLVAGADGVPVELGRRQAPGPSSSRTGRASRCGRSPCCRGSWRCRQRGGAAEPEAGRQKSRRQQPAAAGDPSPRWTLMTRRM